MKTVFQFFKVISLLTVMIVINPHRAILIPFSFFAALGSFLAGKLEDLCVWVGKKVDKARVSFWLLGRPIQARLDNEMEKLTKMVPKPTKKGK